MWERIALSTFYAKIICILIYVTGKIYISFCFVKIYHTFLKLINYCECATACVVRILFEKKLHRFINAFLEYIYMFCENSNS